MIVLIAGGKGGAGKTTAAVNLAAMRAAIGRSVLLIDTDPQGSSASWGQVRSMLESNVVRVTCVRLIGKSLGFDVKDLAKKFDDIVIDAGGRDSVEMRAALVVADRAYLPMQASSVDLWTLEMMNDLVQTARGFNPDLSAVVYISRAPTAHTSHDIDDARLLVNEYPGISLSQAILSERVAFKRAIGAGLSVIEYGEDAKASDEMKFLYKEVYHDESIDIHQTPSAC
jgi:chromosome partitioning protein